MMVIPHSVWSSGDEVLLEKARQSRVSFAEKASKRQALISRALDVATRGFIESNTDNRTATVSASIQPSFDQPKTSDEVNLDERNKPASLSSKLQNSLSGTTASVRSSSPFARSSNSSPFGRSKRRVQTSETILKELSGLFRDTWDASSVRGGPRDGKRGAGAQAQSQSLLREREISSRSFIEFLRMRVSPKAAAAVQLLVTRLTEDSAVKDATSTQVSPRAPDGDAAGAGYQILSSDTLSEDLRELKKGAEVFTLRKPEAPSSPRNKAAVSNPLRISSEKPAPVMTVVRFKESAAVHFVVVHLNVTDNPAALEIADKVDLKRRIVEVTCAPYCRT